MDRVSNRERDMVSRKLKNLSKEEKIDFFKYMFMEQTKIKSRYIHNNPNGFLALGVFKTPQDHIVKKVNNMWLFGVGVGKTEDEITPFEDLPINIVEVESFIEVLTEGLKKAKELGVKKTVGAVTNEKKMSVIHSKNYAQMYSDIFLLFKKYNVTMDAILPHLELMQEVIKEQSEKEKEEMKLGKYDKMKKETLRLLKKDIDDNPNMDRDFKKRLEIVMQDIDDSTDEYKRIIETSRRMMIENGELELKDGTYRITEKWRAKMNEEMGNEIQKFIGKIKTEGYNEFLIEADSIEDAQKIWDGFEYKLIREDRGDILFQSSCETEVEQLKVRKFDKTIDIE